MNAFKQQKYSNYPIKVSELPSISSLNQIDDFDSLVVQDQDSTGVHTKQLALSALYQFLSRNPSFISALMNEDFISALISKDEVQSTITENVQNSLSSIILYGGNAYVAGDEGEMPSTNDEQTENS